MTRQYKVEFTDRTGFQSCAVIVTAEDAQQAQSDVRALSEVQPGCRVFAYPATLNVHGVVDAAMHRGGDVAAFLAECASRYHQDCRECMEAYRALHAEWSERCYQASLPGLRAAAERFGRSWIREGD